MPETKHTPGPWKIYDAACGLDYYPGIEVSNSSKSIIVFGTDIDDQSGVRGDSRTERIANAKLIAAAPELLEALMMLLETNEALPNLKFSAEVKAYAAIKKATT